MNRQRIEGGSEFGSRLIHSLPPSIRCLLPPALLALVVVPLYFGRIADPPLVGEEPRWACGAEEMLRTGDWIVPRQQGQVFPERPPFGSWAMALMALVRGTEVDVFAIRLPSILAVLATALVVYAYARCFLTALGALGAGLAYATFGQVLQIGRLGESEALFALFVGSSLLFWHLGYARSWPMLITWSVGYSLAALGALVKGPQAPIYFVAVTCVYLALQRDWKRLFDWRQLVGVACFAAIVGAWQVPFFLATDWGAVQATWGGLAGDRFVLQGFFQHLALYPLEVAVCLLPWSPLLLAFLGRRFRASLGDARGMTIFLVTAVLVTFPSVLFAALARGRYFMPLYPCLAVLVGLVVERCAENASLTFARRGWVVFLAAWGMFAAVAAGAAFTATLTNIESLNVLDQPPWFAILFVVLAAVLVCILSWTALKTVPQRVCVAIAALALFSGLFRVGLVTNIECVRNNPLEERVLAVKSGLSEPGRLVSFGPVDHRFVYFYREPIEEIPWPVAAEQVPEHVEYFCMNRFPSDTPEFRSDGRGRTSRTVPGTLPVQWEQVAEVPVNRRYKPGPQLVVVVGKIVRDVASDSSLESRDAHPNLAERPTTER
jgi:4-amino-4-deoxy-L-arabinose transferase-like glycosyltransferase